MFIKIFKDTLLNTRNIISISKVGCNTSKPSILYLLKDTNYIYWTKPEQIKVDFNCVEERDNDFERVCKELNE